MSHFYVFLLQDWRVVIMSPASIDSAKTGPDGNILDLADFVLSRRPKPFIYGMIEACSEVVIFYLNWLPALITVLFIKCP